MGSKKAIWTNIFKVATQIPIGMKWIITILTSITAIGVAYSDLNTSLLIPIADKLSTPSPPKKVVFITSDQLIANSYLKLLSEEGFEFEYLHFSQIEELVNYRARLIVISGSYSTEPDLLNLSEEVREYLASDIKVLAMGNFGARFIQAAFPDSSIGVSRAAHGFDNSAITLNQSAPDAIRGTLPLDKSIYPYELPENNSKETNIDNLGIYDSGSLELYSAKGVGQEPASRACRGKYWRIAIQGNLATWGYSYPAHLLTDEGKSLYLNLVRYLYETPSKNILLSNRQYEPGTYTDTVGCNFIKNTYSIVADKPGKIKIRARSKEPISLILNGPTVPGSLSRKRPFDREDGLTPQVDYLVTPEVINTGKEWKVSVTYFGELTEETKIFYDLSMEFPSREKQNFMKLWSPLGILSLAFIAIGINRISYCHKRIL